MGPRGRKHRSRRGGRKRHGSRWEEAGLPAGNQIAEESRHSGDRSRRVPEDTRCVAQLEVHCLLFMILPYLDYPRLSVTAKTPHPETDWTPVHCERVPF